MAFEFEPDPDPDRDRDLSWLALCYVAGELGRDEVEAFELRLEQDQAAREAVAEAVALAGAMAVLEPAHQALLPLSAATKTTTIPLHSRTIFGSLAAVVVAAAACLTWLLVGIEHPTPETLAHAPAPVPTPAQAQARTIDIADTSRTITPKVSLPLAWSKLRFESDGPKDDDEEGEQLAWNCEVPILPEVAFPISSEVEEGADQALPLWLLDAASLAGHSDPVPDGESVKER